MTRNAMAIAVALVLATAGCATDAPTGPEIIGSLTISVSGLVTPVPNGGTVRLVRTDVHKDTVWVFQLPDSGSLTVPMPVGTYEVRFEPPAGYTVGYVVQTVTVTQVEGAEVQFGVTLTTGTLEIVANLDGPPWPKDGGTISLVRTDIDGQPPQTVTIPFYVTDGYYDAFEVQPGAYLLSYSPPPGFSITAGTPDHASVRVATGVVTVANFFAVPVPP